MRLSRLLPLTLLSLALGACALLPPWLGGDAGTTPPPASSKASAKVTERQTVSMPRVARTEFNGAYRLDTGDRVRILVAGQDSLSNSYEIDAGGAIEISSIGRIPARGLNTIQLSGAIERKLKQIKVPEAHVAVQIETYRPFTIRGEVANPGQYPYVNNMTTETAIAIAGGLKARTDKKSVTIRNGETEDNPPTSSLPESPVRPGDTIIVNEER
jgi:polysaccharide biosynthesis/export protein